MDVRSCLLLGRRRRGRFWIRMLCLRMICLTIGRRVDIFVGGGVLERNEMVVITLIFSFTFSTTFIQLTKVQVGSLYISKFQYDRRMPVHSPRSCKSSTFDSSQSTSKPASKRSISATLM